MIFRMQSPATPFIQRSGGKRGLLSDICPILEGVEDYTTYYELFVGGGAVFFDFLPPKAYLSDTDKEVVNAFLQVKKHKKDIIAHMEEFALQHNRSYFEYVGNQWVNEQNLPRRAAMYIYLNRMAMNGHIGVDKAGKFKAYIKSTEMKFIPPISVLENANEALQNAVIKLQGYDKAPIDPNGLYYLDPPYHQTANFYGGTFDEDDQRALADFCYKLDGAGARFVLSNSDTDFIRKLYAEFSSITVQTRASLPFQGTVEQPRTELLITNIKV